MREIYFFFQPIFSIGNIRITIYPRRCTQTLYSNVKLTAERDAATGDLVWKSKDNTTLVGGLSDEHYYLYYPY